MIKLIIRAMEDDPSGVDDGAHQILTNNYVFLLASDWL